jgi:hypothetical protein
MVLSHKNILGGNFFNKLVDTILFAPKKYLPSLKNIGSHYRGTGGDALNLLEC